MIGQKILHYNIVAKLGEGGMGVVYKAEDTKLKRDVAIKFLPRQIAASEDERERFKIEAQAAAALNHPRIATIHAIEEVDDELFIVMEYIEGRELRAMMDSLAKVQNPRKVLDIATQIAEGLQAAHEKHITHRDIKSANIMITDKGQVKIMDFGLAKIGGGAQLTKDHSTLGTAAYMSPEQAQGKTVDHRTDIWSFGVVLYEMVSGRLPFKGDYEQAVLYSIMHEQAEPITNLRPDVPAGLEQIVKKTLVKNPSERYRQVDEMLADLRSLRKELESGSTITKRTQAGARPKRRARRKRIQSLVVLPLTNLSCDPEQEYFADGMTEALIANLAKLRALRIISRTSAMRYKGSNNSLPEIAEELNVDAVLEGSVLRVGRRVRITTQLIHAATDTHLWAESYERDLQDILLLQSEVAQTVAREIQVAVTPEEKKRLASSRRVNPEAYEAYFKGRFHYWKMSPEDLDKALEYYNLALEKDPDYALAYTGIGDVWGARGCWGFVLPHEAFSIGKPAALKAVELDDELAEGHEMLARYKFFYEWDWAAAESESQRAIALNPNNPDIGFAYLWLLWSTRRPAEAMVQLEHALELDPFNLSFQTLLGWQFTYRHRYGDAIAQFRKTLATEPNFPWAHWGLWSGFHLKGITEQALAEAKQYLILMGNREAAEAMGNGHAGSSYQAAMLQGAKKLVAQAKQRYVQMILIARLYAHAEENDLALDWLEKAYEVREPWLVQLNVDFDWDTLRDDPRFTKLVKRVGLEK